MATITPATSADIKGLIQLENNLFTSDRISPRQFRYLINRANSIVVKAEEERTILGYMVLLKRRDSRKLRLYSIAVASQARKLGIARQMLAFAEQAAAEHNCASVVLEVCETNTEALQLYKSAGFGEYGSKPGYYENGCTAKLFSKQIPVNRHHHDSSPHGSPFYQ